MQQRQQSAARRIYVGSVAFDVGETELRLAFSPFGAISSVTMTKDVVTGHHKGFAFVEFVQPESAQLSLAVMNGFMLGGRALKVGPPNTNTSAAGPLPSAPVDMDLAIKMLRQATENVAPVHGSGSAAVGVLSASSTSNRIYVGSLPYDVTEDDVKSIFSSFGRVISCQLIPNPDNGRHKGYGFVEFDSPASAAEAISSMNGVPIGGRPIKVGRCTSSNPPGSLPAMSAGGSSLLLPPVGATSSFAVASAGPSSLPSEAAASFLKESSLSSEENISIRGQDMRVLLMQKLQRSADTSVVAPSALPPSPSVDSRPLASSSASSSPSRVVVLSNMVTLADVDDALQDEVSGECRKFGAVEKVVIVKGTDRVRIFVAFAQSREAAAAIETLDKRFFGGKQISAAFYPEDGFLQSKYWM